jgi:hypothetical protein
MHAFFGCSFNWLSVQKTKKSEKIHLRIGVFLSSFLVLSMPCAYAADEGDTDQEKAIVYKLTPSYYASSSGNNAADINIRGSTGPHSAWLGEYHDKAGFNQLRSGYEYRQEAGGMSVVWSAQLATGGFVGGSVTAALGGINYAIIGWGRTNLRDIGTRAVHDLDISLFQVRDDRLGTRQRVTHYVARYKPSEKTRITLDTSYKSGLANNNTYIHGYAFSFTFDYDAVFFRIGRDQYANFTADRLTRVSLGARF